MSPSRCSSPRGRRGWGRGVVDLFEELHSSGQTIVLITHDMGLAGLASRVVQIRDGEIVEDLDVAA